MALLLRSPHALKSLGNTYALTLSAVLKLEPRGGPVSSSSARLGWEGRGGGTCAFPSDFTPTASPAPLEMGCENQHAGGRAGRCL